MNVSVFFRSQPARWAVAALFFLNGAVLGSWASQIPVMVRQLQITEFTLGMLLVAFGVGALIFMPLSGWLMARYGSRNVTLAFTVAFVFALPCVSLITSLWPAYILLFLFGGVSGGMDVSMNANAAVVEQSYARPIMSSSHGFWSLGGFVGGAAGGTAIETLGFVGHAFAVGVISAALLMVTWRHVIKDPAADFSSKLRFSFPKSPTIYLIGLIALLGMIPEGAIRSWSALYLTDELGADLAFSGWAFAALSATMAIVRFSGDSVRAHFGAVRTLQWSSLTAAVGLLVAGLSGSYWVVMLAFAFVGLGIANIVPIAFSAAGNQAGVPTGVGMSVSATMGYAGTLAAPSLIGLVAERTGFSMIFVAFSLFMMLIFFMANLVRTADFTKS
ncbi:MFS transporter [Aureimonas fodinaquatilis]|uniref:MFS transporter n=1 Tax=Aureimonas fodinaquatilis TaxID=2565783 RepID=UPI001FE618B4|nr:MFS transporter [Aureimonas fodinaquatilis]